ncbi:hypothetical protein Ddye_006486 [Dipteronia dyeriana]|uniref:CHCH domain-containing protein n=1 Tax=Dipteronia dyeriana TaxID=168575 RepID=A0AAE0CR82_9ROSI|nr:hypothetical protein Ddye_006486 [Dipteronia dyeriana]
MINLLISVSLLRIAVQVPHFTTLNPLSIKSQLTMPRRSYGEAVTHYTYHETFISGKSVPRPRSAAHAPICNPPQPVARASPPAVAQGGNGTMMGGVGAAVADGLAFGAGSAVAHRAVDVVLGPRVIHHETVTSSSPAVAPAPVSAQNASSLGGANACGGQFNALQDCLNSYGSDISKCQFYMDMLQECRRGSGAAALGA